MAKRSASVLAHDGDASRPTRSLIERAYLLMRNDIIDGRLMPGEKLRVEHLKRHYGVGAGTLREAITRLASDAMVTAESQRGFRVTPISVSDLEDLTRLRLHIELEALRQSIRHGNDTWRDNVRLAYDDLSMVEQPLHPRDRTRWELCNGRFHEALVAGCGSPWTLSVLRLLARHGERYRSYVIALPESGRDVHAEHKEIFELAMQGNDARAALALEAHIRNTLDLIVRAQHRGIDVFKPATAEVTTRSASTLQDTAEPARESDAA